MQDIRKEYKGREVTIPTGVEQSELKEVFPDAPKEAVDQRVVPAPLPVEPVANISSSISTPVISVDPIQKNVENILQEDMLDLYKELSPIEQQQFKIKGEETAKAISQIVRAMQVKIQDIINLIKDWLKVIPGVKNYFVEQEAKIKAEKILKLQK